MSFVIILVTLMYLFLIGSFVIGFDKVNIHSLENDAPRKTTFSVIVPFRNEANNLPELIQSLSQLTYPKELYEVIFVDDDSQDRSRDILINNLSHVTFKFQILENKRQSKSPKKDAINTAIHDANHDWIITTDADCSMPKQWLECFDSYIKINHYHLICGPVTYSEPRSIFENFQTLDFLSLIGTTIGSFGINKPFMANGANLAYKKSFFMELEGFHGNDHIASGDDVFLLQKALKLHSNAVGYLKSMEALVVTKPVKSYAEFLSQRIRWASKASQYKVLFGSLVGLLVFVMNLNILLSWSLVFLDYLSEKIALYSTIIKICVDFLLLFKVTRFTKQEHLLKLYPFSAFIYPWFCCLAACLAFMKSYTWKDRKFSK